MDRQILAAIFQEGGRVISGLLQTYRIGRPGIAIAEPKSKEPGQEPGRVSTDETVQYQKREIIKELTLLEGHLQQGCKINSKACDCCSRHPLKIEGLAQETISMSPDPVFRELAKWTRSIASITTEAAAASGEHDEEYPRLAIDARNFRKAIMSDSFRKEVEHGEISTAEE